MQNYVCIVLLLFVSGAIGTIDLQTIQSMNFTTIQATAVSSDYIFVAEESVLHLLHTNLTHHSSVHMGLNFVSKMALSSDKTAIIIFSVDGSCKVCKIQDLLADDSATCTTLVVTASSTKSITLGVVSNSTFYTGSEEYNATTFKRSMILKQFEYNWRTAFQVKVSDALIITNSNFQSRKFYDVFQNEQYVYYVAVDTIGGDNSIVVMRTCDEANLSAIMEIKLDCGLNETFNFIYSSVLYNVNKTDGLLVIATSSSSTSGGQVCVYELTDIDEGLYRAYFECISTNKRSPPPWTNRDHTEDCSSIIQVCIL